MKIIITDKRMMIIMNNDNNNDNYHNDHFSRSRAPGQRNNVRDGAVLANKKRVIQFFMIFYSFPFIPDLIMFVIFVMILFLNLFVYCFCNNETHIFQFFVFYIFPDCPRLNVLKVIKMLVIVVLLFGISWLPYQVLLMAFSFSHKNTLCLCRV